MAVNRDELVTVIARRNNMSRKVVNDVIDAFVDLVREAIIGDEVVRVTGFGVFEPRMRKPRQMQVPGKGLVTTKAARNTYFRVSRVFKESLNK